MISLGLKYKHHRGKAREKTAPRAEGMTEIYYKHQENPGKWKGTSRPC